MSITPQQPHRSWYKHFWYAERSPRDTLTDRTLLFGVVALGLLAAGMLLVHRDGVPHTERGLTTAAQVAR